MSSEKQLHPVITDAEFDLLDAKRVSPTAVRNLRAPTISFNRKASDFSLAYLVEAGESDTVRGYVLLPYHL